MAIRAMWRWRRSCLQASSTTCLLLFFSLPAPCPAPSADSHHGVAHNLAGVPIGIASKCEQTRGLRLIVAKGTHARREISFLAAFALLGNRRVNIRQYHLPAGAAANASAKNKTRQLASE